MPTPEGTSFRVARDAVEAGEYVSARPQSGAVLGRSFETGTQRLSQDRKREFRNNLGTEFWGAGSLDFRTSRFRPGKYSDDTIRNMSDRHVRATDGSPVVLAVTDLYHREGKNNGRICNICGARWTALRDGNDGFHVWRNGVSTDNAILDWVGNNAVVECCGRPV